MKKALGLALAFVLALSILGCGNAASPESGTASSESGAEAPGGNAAYLDRTVEVQGLTCSVPPEWEEVENYTDSDPVTTGKTSLASEDEGISLTIVFSNRSLDWTVEDDLASTEEDYEGNPVYAENYACELIQEETIDGVSCPLYHLSFVSNQKGHEGEECDVYQAYLYGPDIHYEITLEGGDEQLMSDILGTVTLD